MYPTLSDLLYDIFGINLRLPVQTFGLLLAVSFFLAAWTLSLELKRKAASGIFSPVKIRTKIGEKVTFNDLLISFLPGFIAGFKLLYIFTNYDHFVEDTQGVLLSLDGSWVGGIALGAFAAYQKYNQKKKQELETPLWKEEEIPVTQLVGNITMVAAIAGIIGAKVFHNLENLDDFEHDPVDALLSFSGLTMYGGLIVGGLAVLWYVNKHKIPVLHFMDATAPGLMLAYGSGRVGCQLAGDGDWGITNLHPKPDWLSWLPDWAWAYHYPHNVINEGVPIPGCIGRHCMMLPDPVYPTPLYEAIICIGLFFVLWSLRKQIKITGSLFCLYLVMNGIERFFIEKIRINNQYHIFGFGVTQAEIISALLVIGGVTGYYLLRKNASKS